MKKGNRLRVIYVAHPFGGNFENLSEAERWAAFLTRKFCAVFVAPWIPLCRYWSDKTDRELGISIDVAAVREADGIILVGPEVSPGMSAEWTAASIHGIPAAYAIGARRDEMLDGDLDTVASKLSIARRRP
jgi:hypothetical protein